MDSSNSIFPDLIAQLDLLTPETQGQWGQMTAQHMIEHLTAAVLISSGDLKVAQQSEDSKLPALRAFLFSQREMPRNIKTQAVPDGLLPLRNPDLKSAIDALKLAIEKFHQYHQDNPGEKPVNPVFGPLSFNEWIHFHQKHFRHHYTQFGLIEK